MQTEHTPLLSIIVPIYNVEEYLPECLNSIFAQTFTDYELILVDDGSPDNCTKMCDEAAEALIDRLLEMRLTDAVPASEKMMFTSLRNVYYHLPPEQRRDPRTKDAKRRHWATLRKMRTHHCLPVKTAVRSAAFHLAPALCRRWWADCR